MITKEKGKKRRDVSSLHDLDKRKQTFSPTQAAVSFYFFVGVLIMKKKKEKKKWLVIT